MTLGSLQLKVKKRRKKKMNSPKTSHNQHPTISQSTSDSTFALPQSLGE